MDIDNDNYFGSGIIISKLLKKHSRDNFKRTIIAEFNSENDAKEFEEKIVNDEFISQTHVLNIARGGQGGSGVAKCLTKAQRLQNGQKAAAKLRGRSKDTHSYLALSGTKTKQRFNSMSVQDKKEYGARCLSWMQDAEKKSAAMLKRAAALKGRTKLNHPGRKRQASKINGTGNGSAVMARRRLEILNEIDLRKLPISLFSKKHNLEKQFLAIEQLRKLHITQGESAKIAGMPISSFNALVSKIISHVTALI